MSRLLQVGLWAVCALCFLYAYDRLRRNLAYRRAALAKGCLEPRLYPHRDPVFGLDLFIAQMKNYKHHRLLEQSCRWVEQCGDTYQTNSLGVASIKTIEPENVQTIFAHNFEDYGLGPLRTDIAGDFMGRGIFTTDGKFWEHSRALVRPIFTKAQFADLNTLKVHVDRFISLIPRDGSTIDLLPLLHRLALDTSTEFLVGTSVDSLLPSSSPELKHFKDAFDYAQRGIEMRAILGKLKVFYRNQKWNDAIDIVHAFFDKHVDRAITQVTAEKNALQEGQQAQRHVLLYDMAKQTQDRLDLRFQTLNVFIPAHESTGIAISNVLFHLSRNQVVWKKLRTEILGLGSKPLNFENLKSLNYLRYVLNESHRLTPVIPMNTRICLQDSILPRGGGPDGKSPMLVQKGSLVTANLWAMQRNKAIWGPDAEVFRPERWESIRPGWNYVPFLGGPRICPAQQMVLTESAYVVVRLMQEFRAIESRDAEPWTESLKVTVANRNGVKVSLTPA